MRNLKFAAAALMLSTGLALSGCGAQEEAPAVQDTSEADAQQAAKDMVIEFYNQAINEKDYEAAAQYLGDTYIQHNPVAADGPEGLKGYIEFLRNSFPEQHNEIKRAFVDGDYVILHVHSVQKPDTLGRAIVDIFRLEDGKVVEHWDVIQEVVDPAEARNPNGMF